MDNQTLYQHATMQMRLIIDKMINLAEQTANFHAPTTAQWANHDDSTILLSGKGYGIGEIPDTVAAKEQAWLARSAIAFGIERAATGLLYQNTLCGIW